MLKLLDPCSIIRVQSWDIGIAVPPEEEVLGLQWPITTGSVACGRWDILCIGPTDWLVLAPDPTAVLVAQALSDAFAKSVYRATDVSSALAQIQVEGVHARALLAKGCSLDLYPVSFPPGRCARTRFAGMPVIVRRTGDSAFECIVTISYAEYLISWLADAALEFEDSAA